MPDIENKEIFINDENIYNKKTQSVPKPETNIGIDTKNTIINKIADLASLVQEINNKEPVDLSNITQEGKASVLDLTSIESFTRVSQSRDQIYALLDTMCEDSMIAAVLETYAEDATEYNDQGQVVWAESADSNIAKYVTFLLDTMNVDKNIYKWVYSLCKYGDVYLRLYRKSDYAEDDILEQALHQGEDIKESKILNEDVNIIAHSKSDKYAHYVEMVPNPAEMFELTKFGKTYAYIKTDVMPVATNSSDQLNNQYSYIAQYRFRKSDVDIHGPMDYVHATLDDNSSRTPEEVSIFIEKDSLDGSGKTTEQSSGSYTVKRGQSLLYNVFKIWRELSLLENSVLLNRLTRSSIVRLINVEVGDMPKNMIGPHLQGIKSLMEQKAAINTGNSMTEYTNPGPVENNIYIPTHDGIGAITTDQVGGEVNVGQLTDLDYFKNKFYGAMRVPKQYFGDTEDGAGFNGGQSLSIISSRYAKMIKRIQNAVCQMLTDAVNLMLIDKGMNNYVNKFTIHMLPPTTQEEIDRRDNLSSKVAITGDIMNNLGDIEDPVIKLKILKALLSNILSDNEVINLIQEQIDKMESEGEDIDITPSEEQDQFDTSEPLDLGSDLGLTARETPEEVGAEEEAESGEESLPSPEELGVDMTNNDNEE